MIGVVIHISNSSLRVMLVSISVIDAKKISLVQGELFCNVASPFLYDFILTESISVKNGLLVVKGQLKVL